MPKISDTTTISQLGELGLLKKILPLLTTNSSLIEGAGDDCAIVECNADTDMLLKCDCVVEGLHFLPNTPPSLIGRKALARTISDIAAMGGTPEHALITLMVHPSRPASLIEGIYQGLNQIASEYGISLAGGECSALTHDGLAISITLTGTVPHRKAILRRTAQAGDLIAVTGKLGGSFPSNRHLTFTPRVKEGNLLRASGLITAMMDLSDGLASDLPRLAKASGLSFHLNLEKLPCHEGCTHLQALKDGEDYELLFTFAPQNYEKINSLLPCTIIGEMTKKKNTHTSLPGKGWEHFSEQK